jgi:hypothetical protein
MLPSFTTPTKWPVSLLMLACAAFAGSAAFGSDSTLLGSPIVYTGPIESSKVYDGAVESLIVDNGEFQLSQGSSISKAGPDLYKLTAGTVLVHPATNVRIETPNGSILISKNAVVLVKAEHKISRFFVLSESFGGTVRVFTDKHFKKAGSGEELDVIDAASADDATHLVIEDGSRRRHLQLIPVSQTQFISTDQFSIPDAMLRQELIADLHRSEQKSRRALYERILKTAAAISICGPSEPYAQHD